MYLGTQPRTPEKTRSSTYTTMQDREGRSRQPVPGFFGGPPSRRARFSPTRRPARSAWASAWGIGLKVGYTGRPVATRSRGGGRPIPFRPFLNRRSKRSRIPAVNAFFVGDWSALPRTHCTETGQISDARRRDPSRRPCRMSRAIAVARGGSYQTPGGGRKAPRALIISSFAIESVNACS